MTARNTDKQGRFRSQTVAFRVSPEEYRELNLRVKRSGLNKREYLYRKAMDQEIKVFANPRVYKALKEQLTEIQRLLSKEAEGGAGMKPETLSRLREIVTMIADIRGKE